jgi:hypothetical protein
MSDRDMRRLIRLLEQKLGLSWADITEWLRGQNSLDAITARLEARDYAGAVSDVEAAAQRFAADLHAAYLESGQRSATWLDDRVPDKLIRFDQANTRAVSRARTNEYELIRGFTADQREITRNIITDGMARGTNPREMARDLRDSIGLTEAQEAHVRNYRRALESGDYLRATGYELSSGQADRTLRRLDAAGKALTPAQIDDFVGRYRSNYIDKRSLDIARTEALRAAHDGHDDAMMQAIQRGEIDRAQLKETWNAGPATRFAREDHQAMDGVSVVFGEDFVLPDGTRMRGPGDPRGGARHCLRCRCCKSTELVA